MLYKKFTAVIKAVSLQCGVFVTASHNLTFVGKAGAYQSGVSELSAAFKKVLYCRPVDQCIIFLWS
jgi:hypothetical protein